MGNFTWNYTEIQAVNLPEKARRFIDIINLDVSDLTLVSLETDPNGSYYKNFGDDNKLKGNYERYQKIIYFIGRIEVGTAIHELTHFYLDGTDHDTEAIAKNFIKQHGQNKLSNYATYNLMSGEWDEVVCEIAAMFGRRGQFKNVKEMLSQTE